MQEESYDCTDKLQGLSALADGELDAQTVISTCVRWRDDVQLRARWHAYHLIGDVLRSDALASDAGHDEHFLRRLRERLADEPAVLAPQPLARPVPEPPRTGARLRWLAPAAVAAGFMAVASVLVVMRGTLPATGGEGAELARAAAPADRTAVAIVAPPARSPGTMAVGEGWVEPQALAVNGQFVRDAKLDRYLEAHMEFGGSSALGAPSGFLRAATSRTQDR